VERNRKAFQNPPRVVAPIEEEEKQQQNTSIKTLWKQWNNLNGT
jgi:hypothetical protein